MSQAFVGRIDQAESSHSIDSQTKRPQSINGASVCSAAAAVAAAFEIENMDALRDSEPGKRRASKRSSRIRRVSDGGCLSTIEQQEQSNAKNHHRSSRMDHDEEPLLSAGRPTDNNDDDDDVSAGGSNIDQSVRSLSSSYRLGIDFSTSSSSLFPSRTISLSIVIGVVGVVVSTLFMGFGIQKAAEEQERLFAFQADEFTQEFNRVWLDYMVASLWVYQVGTVLPSDQAREGFSNIYQGAKSYVDVRVSKVPEDVPFWPCSLLCDIDCALHVGFLHRIKAVQWIPRVLDDDRQALEEEAYDYYQAHYPDEVGYQGIMEIILNEEDWNDDIYLSNATLRPRSRQEFYYPVHLIEPIDEQNIPAIELDLLTSDLHSETLKYALETYQPAATAAYRRVTVENAWSEDQYIQLFHPGIQVSDQESELEAPAPRDLAALVIRIKSIVEASSEGLAQSLSLFVYDSTASDEEPEFLVAAELYTEPPDGSSENVVYILEGEEISLSELIAETVRPMHINEIDIASRTWTLVAVALEDTFQPDILYVTLSGKFIMVVSLFTSLWIITNHRSSRVLAEVKRRADLEKTKVIIGVARDKARSERELNDYIAHEIRNPRKFRLALGSEDAVCDHLPISPAIFPCYCSGGCNFSVYVCQIHHQ